MKTLENFKHDQGYAPRPPFGAEDGSGQNIFENHLSVMFAWRLQEFHHVNLQSHR